MKKNFTEIEIPFGVKDSELYQFTYTIPDGYFAEIKDGKVIVQKKESDDERIRKNLIQFLRGEIYEIDVEEAVAYLEKQKDKVVKFDHDREQKHKIARWKPLGECSDIPDGHYVVGWFRFADFRLGIMCNGLFVDTNGNRAEQPKEIFYIPNADEEFIYAEQQSAEWNDTDMKEARNNLISVCRDWEFGKQTTLLPVAAVHARYFLEHLTEPKPAEWSEGEREDRVRDIVAAVKNFYNEPIAKELIDFLKLLYHGVEDEYGQEMLAVAYKAIFDNIPPEKRTKEINDSLAFMRQYTGIAVPQPHWKPSEEDLAALEYCAEHTCPELLSLYLDLKKLL